MGRTDRAVAALVAVAAIGGLVGCDDGDGGGQTTAAAPAPQVIRVNVIDGDTRAPVPGATIEPVSSSGPPPPPIVADDAGSGTIPVGVAGVCASSPNRSRECRTVLPDRLADITVPIYNPALSSPEYGGGPSRTRYVPAVRVPPPSSPPAWTHRGRVLLEFPPSIARGVVVLTTNRGRVFAFNARTGAVRWQKRHTVDNYIASSPAITGDQVLISGMDGRLVSYALDSGRVNWEFSAGRSPIESSPLVVGDTVYVGAHNGLLYAVSVATGRRLWVYQADDDIKGSAALAGGNLIFGDYSGNVYAVRASDGAGIWRVKAGQRFYGGAGIASGIAVLGDVGGGVVALNARTGRRLWRHSTGGGIVYASPAIAGGTVFIGSYNGRFEALDLRTGAVRWSRDVGGRVGGSATVVANTVYTAVLARPGEPDRTYGLDVDTGAVRWTGDDGRYSPAAAAGRTLYIVGRTNLYAYPAP